MLQQFAVSFNLKLRTAPQAPDGQAWWLFSAPLDLTAFLGSAIVALGLLAVGSRLNILHADTPDWTWIGAVLLVDVAHVYATGFRVYFDPAELGRHPWLYALAPSLGFLIGVAIFSEGDLLFWRALAYLAVFHFVRQQYGWVALYRARRGETDRWGWWIDSLAIYLATLYPLIYWHAHLPRRFWWFLKGDFLSLPAQVETAVAPLYWGALGLYVVRAVWRAIRDHEFNPGKDIVVVTTAVCWHLGIITFNSDYAFTVTNVVIHGIPYLVLVYWYRQVAKQRPRSLAVDPLKAAIPKDVTSRRQCACRTIRNVAGYLAVIWLLAYAEELAWDRTVWHERAWLFGPGWTIGGLKTILIPLLAVPQMTHYILDGFLWRRRSGIRRFTGDRQASLTSSCGTHLPAGQEPLN